MSDIEICSKYVSSALDVMRATPLSSHEGARAILYATAIEAGGSGGIDPEAQRSLGQVADGPAASVIEAAAKAILRAPRHVRLTVVDDLLSRDEGRNWFGMIRPEAAHALSAFVGTEGRVRCVGEAVLRAALQISADRAEQSLAARTVYVGRSPDMATLATTLALVLGCGLTVEVDDHAFEAQPTDADFQILAPALGRSLDRSEYMAAALERLGISDEKGRVTEEVLALASAQSAVRSRSLVLVAEGVLFRGVGVEVELRERLLLSGRLKAVMAFPTGGLWANMSVSSAGVVIEPAGANAPTTRFVDLGSDRFSEADTRGRRRLRFSGALVEALSASSGEDIADILQADALRHDANLMVSRHLVKPWRHALDAVLGTHKTARLDEVCEIIRPTALKKDAEGEHAVREAAPGDILESGYLGLPSRLVRVTESEHRAARQQMLRPGDVVLSVKGGIGAVGLVPDDVDGADAAEIWVVGQSLAILRRRRDAPISSVALYEFMSSEPVTEQLRAIAGGATIPVIPVKDLRRLEVALPERGACALIDAAFRERQAIYAQLRTLRDDLQRMRRQTWPHDLMGGACKAESHGG